MVKADRVGSICYSTLYFGMRSAQAASVCLSICLDVDSFVSVADMSKFATCHNKVCRVYGMSLSPKVGKGQHL